LKPIQALEHPKFKEMIAISSRGKGGVKIPAQKATQEGIKQMFRKHLRDVKEKINV
jgi:hypothetical protein